MIIHGFFLVRQLNPNDQNDEKSELNPLDWDKRNAFMLLSML